MTHQYTVVFEQSPTSWGAYLPDLPGCVAAGETREEVERLIAEAVALHIAAMHEEDLPIPPPTTFHVES